MIDTEECSAYYWNGADSDVSREDAVKSFFAALRPGDVIIQRAQTGGHALLYIGNGMILHCTNTHAGHDAHDYNYTAKHDAPELFGGIMLSPVDILTDPSSIYFTFSPKYRVRLLRPLMLGVKPTDTAALRAKNLSGVITFKTCTAFDAKTVSKGEDVSFTYVLRNDTKTARTVTVGDRLPEGLKYRSGDVDLTDGGFEADVEIPANSSVSFSYTATVTAENGTLIPCDETLFGGVPANATPFKVGNTLKLPFDAIVAAAGTASGASDIDCINAIYEKTVGAATPIRSAEELMSSSFVFNENLIGSVSSPMLISEYHFGGTAVSCMIEGNTKRIRELTVSEFVPGDLLAILTEESKMRFMLFAGRGRLISFESGSPVLLSAADSAERISSVFAERAFMVLRPSLLM